MPLLQEEGGVPEFEPKRLVSALTGAVDTALEASVAGLGQEICRRAGPAADAAEVDRACGALRARLHEQAVSRAARFNRLALDYLLAVPDQTLGKALPVRPADLISPLQAVDSAAESFGQGKGAVTHAAADEGGAESVSVAHEGQVLDVELSTVSAEFKSAVARAQALRLEAGQLTEQLRLFRAVKGEVDDSSRGGLVTVKDDLREVAEQVARLWRVDGAGGGCGAVCSSPKRTQEAASKAAVPEKRLRGLVLG
mmetsp:Transcript_101596/g.226934  ORF Transcript_101596/g.226934 Transcript_101596/m.226934 type:complete len:254 (+) Transcript_101596:36-797(+)